MSATAELRPMAKKAGRPKKSTRNDRTVKIDSTVLGWAEMVAKARGIPVAEYLTEMLRGPVSRDFGRQMKKMAPGNEADEVGE